jgi:oxaloacetate decarboxylase (Na+ extruding) subunit gamma
MDNTLLHDGIRLLYFGMGTVFAFLILLVLLLQFMSWIVRRWETHEPPASHTQPPDAEDLIDPLTIKIIQAALLQHIHQKPKK